MFPDDKILDRIFMISERLVIFDGLEDVFEHIVKTSTTLTMAEAATIRVFDIETGLLNIVKGYGVTDGFMTQPPIRVGEGITGTVVQTRQPFKSTNVQDDTLCKNSELAMLEGIHSAICVPMNTKDSCIGCITVYRKSTTEFTDHEMMLLSIFAAEAVQGVEKAQLIAELKSQATQDPLTTLWNKKALLNKLSIEIDRCKRHKQNMATLFIDLDSFKPFNDIHGHLMGDKLLHDFTAILRQHSRKIDIIGRFGGDEFVIIAPQTDETGALKLAEKIRSATEAFHFLGSHIDEQVKITCSIGIAMLESDFDVEKTLSAADKALYCSKNNGRNQASVFIP